jgi:hypothetical protein
VVILRLTRKLLSRVGLPTAMTTPSTTVLGDWFAQLIFVGHERYVLLISEHSRLPVVMPGRDLKNLARNFPEALAEVLHGLGIPGVVAEREVEATHEAVIAVTNSRSVLGTLNDFSRALNYHLGDEPDADLAEIALLLSRTPVGPLGYDTPGRVTRRMLRLDAECAPSAPPSLRVVSSSTSPKVDKPDRPQNKGATMRKVTLAFQEVAARITGVSLPIFGISWNPPTPEREIVREVFVFLEDRRALYNDYPHEIDHQVAASVLAIRSELTAALKRLPESSTAAAPIRAMRAACREYLDSTAGPGSRSWGPFLFTTELGRLRAMIGVQVAYLAVEYGIDLEGELLQVIPAELRDERYLEE